MKKYYYPISSTSLATIFGQACILPTSLYKNRLPDIQSKFDNFILLTNHFGCSGSDCCLQIVLTLDEENALIDINGGFFLYEKAIPISRIQKIFFEKAVQVSRTITNITLSTAFIPDNIIEKNDNSFDNCDTSIIAVPQDLVPLTDKNRESYEKFDRILGAVALMKIAHENGCNYSPHYIDLLSKFNSFIEEQKQSVSAINTKYHKVIDTPPDFLKKVVDISTLENEAQKINQTINKNKLTKVIEPSNLDKSAYVCYVLYDYGVGEESRRHKIDELILDNFSTLKAGYEESCAFYYGYNRGYAAFNNQYKKEGKTEIFKYQLSSLLDYYTIESIFEYCFNSNTPSRISILDSWVKPLSQRKVRRGDYLILDTVIRDKKKVSLFSEEWWKNCLSFLAKDSLLFMGYDFSQIITERILKPFAELIREDLSSEYEEKIQKQFESSDEQIKRMETDLLNYKDRVKTLENRIKELSAPHNQNLVVLEPKPGVSNATANDNIAYAKKVINLCSLKLPELKEKARLCGCKVNSKSKMPELVLGILEADKNKDNQLF